MAVTSRPDLAPEGIRLGECLALLRANWWKIAGASLAVGLLTLGYMYTRPNVYKSSATITPAAEEGKQNPALGAFAALGVSVGGPSKVEDLELLFRSNELTARVFSKQDLWPVVLQDRYDAKTGNMKPSWLDGIFGRGEAKPPGPWDAIRAARRRFAVAVNRRAGSIALSFESTSAQGAADVVRRYLDEAKNRLQEEALERANRNKRFIEDQIARTADLVSRERLYSLLGQEMEKEMMARNREQFGFRVVDPPMVADRKSGPKRGMTAVVAVFLSACALGMYFLMRGPQPQDAASGSGTRP